MHIYVDVNGCDVTGDGSRSNPFRSIARAYEAAKADACLRLSEGEYRTSAGN